MRSLPPLPSLRQSRVQMLVLFVAVLLVYGLSTSHTVGLEDDGMFILAMWNGGLAHPPGYPLYTLLGKAVTSLPLGSVAFRAHMTSALFGAGAAVALWWCIRLLVPGALPAWVGALAFAFSRTFWSQAIVAEVYSLNALFFFTLLALCLQLNRRLESPGDTLISDKSINRLLLVLAFLAGLSLANHWPLMVLASPALVLLLVPAWQRILRLSPGLLFLFVLGLLPYVWMMYRSRQEGVVSFYGPIDNWSELLFIFRREGYSGVDHSGTDDLWDKLSFAAFFLRQLSVEMGIGGFLLAAAGLLVQPKRFGVLVSSALLAGFACSSLLLIVLLGFDHSPMFEAVFRVYPLTAYGIMAIWIALGVYWLSGWIARRWSALTRFATPVMAVVLLAPILLLGWQHNNHRPLSYPEDYGRFVLDSLPTNAVLFAGDDVGFGATTYLNLVQGVRPDVTIYEPMGLVLPNRLFDPLTDKKDDYYLALGNFITGTDRPVYIFGKPSPFSGTVHQGPYSRFQSDLDAETRYQIDDALFSRWETLLADDQGDDEWLHVHRNSVSHGFGYVLGASPASDEQELLSRLDHYPHLASQSLAGMIAIAQAIVSGTNVQYPKALLEVITRIESRIDEHTSLQNQALYYALSGAYFLLVRDYSAAELFLVKSLEIWDHPDNSARQQLETFYRELGREEDLEKLRRSGANPE